MPDKIESLDKGRSMLKLVAGTDLTNTREERDALPPVEDLTGLTGRPPSKPVADFEEERRLRKAAEIVWNREIEPGVPVGMALRVLAGEHYDFGLTDETRHQWSRTLLGMGISASFAFARESGVWGIVHNPVLLLGCVPELKKYKKVLPQLVFRVKP